MIPRRIGFFMLTVIASLPTPAQGGQQAYENRTWGFRLTLPGPEWAATEEPGAGGGITVSVTRRIPRDGATGLTVRAQEAAGIASALAARDAALKATDGQPGFSEAQAIEAEVAGRAAPGICVVYQPAKGPVCRVRQLYLVEGGILCTVASFAPGADPLPEDAATAARLLASFELVPLSDAALRQRRLRALAERCDAEVAWSPTWRQAAARARSERRLVIVFVRACGGFEFSPLVSAGLFADLHVVGLVNERFVPWKFRRGEETPFESRQGYGMGPSTFGTAILLVTPDGEVVEETCHLDPRAVDDFLRMSLARHPEAAGPAPTPDEAPPAVRAEQLLRRGELDAAEALLETSTADAPSHRASIHYRRGEHEAALRVLQEARSRDGAAAGKALALDHAGILMALGRYDDATAIIEAPDLGAATPELEPLWLHSRACIAFAREGFAAAVPSWNRLVDGHAGSRWAPFAAAAILSPELKHAPRAPRLGLHTAALAALRKIDPAPLRPAEAGAAADDAAAWLRSSQAPDGSWSYGLEAGAGGDHPTPLRAAVTALAGAALLRRRVDPACAEAAGRALACILRARNRDPEAREPALDVDFSPWALAFDLEFFAGALQAGIGSPGPIRNAARAAIADLRARMRPSGGWSYYLSPRPDPGAEPSPGSMSFTTAAVVLGLLRIRDAGTRVPERMLKSALDLLERARDGNGAFAYQSYAPEEPVPDAAYDAGAAGRGPLIELALLRGGRGSPDRVRTALNRLREHAALLARERGKALMHTGAGGLGCHYLLFDYAFAAEAVRELPEAERAAFRDHLLPLILACRARHGGFQDTPINGHAAGTALALRAFDAL